MITILNKESGRNIMLAKAAHMEKLPGVPRGETAINMPITAVIVRMFFQNKNKPMSENLIIKRVREAGAHEVNRNVSTHMLGMMGHGIVKNHPGGGLWVLTSCMLALIDEHTPKEAPNENE